MSYHRSSYSPKSYFPPVWFAEADDSHLLPDEQAGGTLAALSQRESRRLAAFRRNVAEQQALERKLAKDRKAQLEADKQAELDRIEQERQRVEAIEAYRLPDAIVSPVIADIQQNVVEIEPYLLRKLASIGDGNTEKGTTKERLGNGSPTNAPRIDASEPDYSDDIALIMLLLEAA